MNRVKNLVALLSALTALVVAVTGLIRSWPVKADVQAIANYSVDRRGEIEMLEIQVARLELQVGTLAAAMPRVNSDPEQSAVIGRLAERVMYEPPKDTAARTRVLRLAERK